MRAPRNVQSLTAVGGGTYSFTLAVSSAGNAAVYIYPRNVEGTMGHYANSADFVPATGVATTISSINGPVYNSTFIDNCVTTAASIRVMPVTSAVNSQGTIQIC